MAHIHDKKTMGKKPNLDKGFGIDSEAKKRAIATDYVIDVDKKSVQSKVNKAEPKFTG